MPLRHAVREAFSGEPQPSTILKGTKIARFYGSGDANLVMASQYPKGSWWAYIPRTQISNPGSAGKDIRTAMFNGEKFQDQARKLLAIKDEWSTMTYWSIVEVTQNIPCWVGKVAPQGGLPGGWDQIYIEDANSIIGNYSPQSIQCITF